VTSKKLSYVCTSLPLVHPCAGWCACFPRCQAERDRSRAEAAAAALEEQLRTADERAEASATALREASRLHRTRSSHSMASRMPGLI